MIRETTYNEIFDAQKHFRLIMNSMANPGKIHRLEEEGISPPEEMNKASALIGFSLLNADVSFYVADQNETLTEYLSINTASKNEKLHQADFIFMHGNNSPELIIEAKSGEDKYPETSASLIIAVENISKVPFQGSLEITLKGPGVAGVEKVYISGLENALLNALKIKNSDYPLGVDAILTDKQNQLLCIPRSNTFTWDDQVQS